MKNGTLEQKAGVQHCLHIRTQMRSRLLVCFPLNPRLSVLPFFKLKPTVPMGYNSPLFASLLKEPKRDTCMHSVILGDLEKPGLS